MEIGDTSDKVVIVGGGFGGLAAAVALHKVGVPSIVLERAPGPRQEGFNIGAYSNAWRALEELGVADAVRKGHLAQERLKYIDSNGNVFKQLLLKDMPPPPGRAMHELRVVKRLATPSALTAALPPGTVQYGAKVTGVKLTGQGAEVLFEGGQKLAAKMVVLADGVHSKTATEHHTAKLEYQNRIGWRAIVDVECADQEDLSQPTFHFASGPKTRVGYVPVSYDAASNKMTWFLFMLAPGSQQEFLGDGAQQKAYMQSLVKGWNLPGLTRLVDAAEPEHIMASHIYQRQVQRGKPWFEGILTGVGDCAHATSPDFGQGGAMAIEDAVELGVFIKEAMLCAGKTFAQLSPGEISVALRRYEILRSGRVAHIIDKSRNLGLLFWATGFLPSWLMRRVQGMLLTPHMVMEHTHWQPHGKLVSP